MTATTGGSVAGGSDWDVISVTIPNGAAVSNAAQLGAARIVGIQMPAAWTTAATLSFQASPDDGTYNELVDETGTAITITGVAASQHINPSNPAMFAGVPYVIVRSGTSGSPVNQGAARVIKLVVNRL